MKDYPATKNASESADLIHDKAQDILVRAQNMAGEYLIALKTEQDEISKWYNIARYKLHIAGRSHNWDYYGRSDYVWAG